MRWGGGGTPSIDEPDGEKPKVFPQPEPNEPEIEFDDQDYITKTWSDVVLEHCVLEKLTVPSTSEEYRGDELPEDYTQIEYLENTESHQYINTGLNATSTMRVEIKILPKKQPNINGMYHYFGTNGGIYLGAYGANDRWKYGAGWGNKTGDTIDYQNPTVITAEGDTWTFNGTEVAPSAIATRNYNILIFATSHGSNNPHWYEWGMLKVYSCKIYDNGVLLRDYIPCFNSSNKLGLYDVADHTGQAGFENYNPFYTNAGSANIQFNDWSTYDYSIQGDGSAENPYQISSAMDLAYLQTQSNNNQNILTDKTLVLTKDIYLNDGYFEEDGTYHDGGDGKLFRGPCISNCSNMNFYGNDHTIYGLYTTYERGLFYNRINYVEKLHMANVYAKYGTYGPSCAIGYEVNNAVGCSLESGYVTGYNAAYGLFCNVIDTIKDCVNKGNIFINNAYYGNGLGCAGICRTAKNIVNCKNYGEIGNSGTYLCGGGIAYFAHHILNCENHGEVCAQPCGGIAYSADIIENCKNYGKIVDGGYKARSAGTIVNECYQMVLNCVDYYGTIPMVANPDHCQIVGCKAYDGNIARATAPSKANEIVIKSCNVICLKTQSRGILAFDYDGWNYDLNVKISNCIVDWSNVKVNGGSPLIERVPSGQGNHKVEVANTKIIFGPNVKTALLQANYTNNSNVTLKNILLETEMNNPDIVSGSYAPDMKIESIIIKNANGGSVYYGENFSGFFVKWKTGEIGIKTLDNVGVYMFAIPNETYLQERGFVKAG